MTPNMHSTLHKPRRGRKQDDSLPPSRARDVQRAFRARRAAHLANLEARNSWLEAENSELRKRLGMGEEDPPISGPEPEMLPLGSPGGSSKGEDSLVKSEEDTSPPLLNWDEQQLASSAGEKGKEKDYSQGHEVQSWNARRIDGFPHANALGFDFPSQVWGGDGQPRANGAVQASPSQHHQQLPHSGGRGAAESFQLLPPPHPLYESNPLSYLANLPVGHFVPPPAHSQNQGGIHYEPYPFSWPGQPRQPPTQASNAHQAY